MCPNLFFYCFKTFSQADRANLIHVSYALAYLGSKSYATPALLSSYLELNELSYAPWRTFVWHLNKLAVVLEHRPAFKSLSVNFSFFLLLFIKFLEIFFFKIQNYYFKKVIRYCTSKIFSNSSSCMAGFSW